MYQEVLQEEQQKGSSPPVAEGRAKAARQRAIEGSPHPKEAKWWPGAQPQFEGGEAAAEPEEAEAPAAEAEEQPAAEAAEQPAAEAAEQPAAEAAEQPAAEAEEQPAAEAAPTGPSEAEPAAQPEPAEQPAAATAALAPAAQPAPAAQQAAAAAATPTTGVAPGVPTGTRLRPEDAVASQAQFDGQQAVEQRRKLIDELIATGVPAVTAADSERPRSPWVSVLFLVIPLIAVLFLVANNEDLGGGGAAEGREPAEESGGGGGGGLVASNSEFNTDSLTVQADGQLSIPFDNQDTFDHNVAVYENEADGQAQENPIFQGELISNSSTTYTFDAPEPGDYYFQCDVHAAAMNGTLTIE
jgi:plastocyanin